MNLRKFGVLGVAVAVLAALIGYLVPNANAASTPPWEPDSGALGSIAFYNSSGTVVTSGSDLSNMWAFAQASNNQFSGSDVISQGFTKAQIQYAWPSHTSPTTNWFSDSPYTGTLFPNASAPAPLNTSTNPVVTASNGSSNFAGIASAGTNDTTTGYNNMIQVRMVALGPGGLTTSPNYWETDILVNTATNSWSQVYPAPVAGPTATTTSNVTANKASPQLVGTSITFTATVSPSTAAGTVQFKDGGTNLSTPQPLTSGTSTLTTTTLGAGSHSITATFIPTDSTAFSTSSSASGLSYTITSPATTTTTTLTANPTGPVIVGATTTLTATITPSAAAGSVQFKDGTTNLGSSVPVSAGTATLLNQSFAVGTHSLHAVFTPTDSTAYTASQGDASFVVNPQPATTTTTAITVTQSSPQPFGTNLTLNATVTPSSAVGTVHFFDGTTDVAHASVTSGAATTSYAGLSVGSHSLTAQFVPTDPTAFGSSTSTPAISYSITAAPSTLSLSASPSTSAAFGAAVTLTATVGPAGVGGGTVQFRYLPGDVVIGSQPVSGTTAQIVTSTLPVTTTGVEAVFTPSSANYSASPNQSISYSITPGNTQVALTVSPSSQAIAGTTETLRAAVTPAGAAGTVQFFDGASMLGNPVTVASGSATYQTALAQGPHTLTAMFISSDSATYNNSPTSNSVPFTVLPPPTATTTTLAVTPGTTEPFGTDITFTATVTPSAAGSVTFTDGATTLGSNAVSGGTATFSTTGLSGGAHSVTATFTPADPLSFTGSASSPASLTITAVSTTTSLAVAPVGPVGKGAKVSLTATLTPSAAVGSVTFYNGATILGKAAVANGVAKLTTTNIAVGTAMLTATFVATNGNDFTSSSSSPVSLTVVAPPSITAVYNSAGKLITSGAKVSPGQTVQVHASGFQPLETVKVYLHSTPTLVDTVTASAQGDVAVSVLIPVGTPLGAHTIQLVGSLGTVSFPITVVAASTGGGGNGGVLATTGVNAEVGILTGLLLLAAGLMLITVSRRRGGVRG